MPLVFHSIVYALRFQHRVHPSSYLHMAHLNTVDLSSSNICKVLTVEHPQRVLVQIQHDMYQDIWYKSAPKAYLQEIVPNYEVPNTATSQSEMVNSEECSDRVGT